MAALTVMWSNRKDTPDEDESTYVENENLEYDIYDCPLDPPPGYPREYKTIDILKHWPPTQNLPNGKYCHRSKPKIGVEGDDSMVASCDSNNLQPAMAHLGLCVFDHNRDYEKAMTA